MTLITQSTKAVALGNNATTVWPYTFPIPDQASLTVTLVDVASGNPTVLSPVNYTVTGLGSAIGGTVTYPLSGSPLAPTSYIVIERFVDEVQQTDLVNQGGAYPEDIEDALDYQMMAIQQLQDQVNRSIVFSVADTVETTLPVAAARANKSLTFNSNGDPVATDGLTPGTTVSAAMIPVVTAPTTAAALTALGLPGALLDLLIPSGVEWNYDAGGVVPTGFVFPIGQACTPTYPNYRTKLIAAGSPYGTNGVDPLMPDRRSTTAAGKSNMGGVDNGLLTGGTVLGAVLGTQTVTLSAAQIPAHPHPITDVAHAHVEQGSPAGGGSTSIFKPAGGTSGVSAPSADSTSTAFTGITTTQNNTGGGGSHANVQPTFVCNIILKVH